MRGNPFLSLQPHGLAYLALLHAASQQIKRVHDGTPRPPPTKLGGVLNHVVILTSLKSTAVLRPAEKKSEEYLLLLGMGNGWKGSGARGHYSSLITDSWVWFFSSGKISSSRLGGGFERLTLTFS